MKAQTLTLALCLAALSSLAVPGLAHAKGGDRAGAGGKCNTTAVLPTTAPASDVIMRESFGAADLLRPAGGKGCLKEVYAHTDIGGFWVEYPGGKNTAWLAPSEGQTWRFCASTPDPYEMPSPLQVKYGNGCVASEWFDAVVDHPAALVPLTAPTTTYEVSIDGWPAPFDEHYVGVGFTDSALLYSNLETSAKAWLRLKTGPAHNFTTVIYEFRLNGMDGPVLASGEVPFMGFNQMAVRYDPAAKMVGASLNGVDLGWYPLVMSAPKFVGFEGVGILDNFVVKQAR